MLQAVDDLGNTFHSFTEEEILKIRELDRERKLMCPDCNNPVQLKAGEIKIKHFAHRHGYECSNDYSEPESPQHLRGKILLKEQLEKIYPYSKVELEYKVEATNQRSDVMVIHSDGSHEAYEYQCSPISEEIMNQRHSLYKKAGVKDYWIFGETVHSYHTSKDEGYKENALHKFRGMEIAVNRFQKNVYYIDTTSERFRALYHFNFYSSYSKTVFHIREEVMDLKSLLKFEDFLMNSSIKRSLIHNREAAAKAQEERNRKRAEQEKRLAQIRKDEIEAKEEAKRERVRKIHHDLHNKDNLTKKEELLFNRLMDKHNYKHLPGCLNIEVEHDDLIMTPSYVWQLWIYDEFIYNKNQYSPKKLFVPTIKDAFWKKMNEGVFRAKRTNNESFLTSAHYSFPLYAYISALCMINVLSKLSFKRNYYSIEVDEIQPFEDKWDNILLSISIEEASQRFEEDDSILPHYKNIKTDSKSDELLKSAMIRFLTDHQKRAVKKLNNIEEQAELQKDYRIKIEYINNLMGSLGDVLSEWDKKFITNTYKTNFVLSEKQLKVINRLSAKVEKELNISLSTNNIR